MQTVYFPLKKNNEYIHNFALTVDSRIEKLVFIEQLKKAHKIFSSKNRIK